jgi:hypothetical protein
LYRLHWCHNLDRQPGLLGQLLRSTHLHMRW